MSKHRRYRKKSSLLANLLFLFLFVCLAGSVFFFDPAWLKLVGWNYFEQTSVSSNPVSSSTSQPSDDLPAVKSSDWNLILVNRDHLTDLTPPSLAKIEDIEVDSRIEQPLKEFLAAIRAIEPEESLISGYRSREHQTELYNEAVAELEATGLSHEAAETETRKRIQLPGASEHQTGLAVDISVPSGQSDELAEQLAALAPKYGFILRYPKDRSSITGVDFENWHYRYVGVESAQYMQAHDLVLEDYIARLQAAGK